MTVDIPTCAMPKYLTEEIKVMSKGLQLGDVKVPILLYPGDVSLVSETE